MSVLQFGWHVRNSNLDQFFPQYFPGGILGSALYNGHSSNLFVRSNLQSTNRRSKETVQTAMINKMNVIKFSDNNAAIKIKEKKMSTYMSCHKIHDLKQVKSTSRDVYRERHGNLPRLRIWLPAIVTLKNS